MVTTAPTRATATAPAPTTPTTPTAPAVRLCALRGATTVACDTPAAVAEAVAELLHEIVHANAIAPEHVLSAIFSATPDVRSLHPATVARALGWVDVPMLCVAEMDVDGALPRCVRVLLHLAVPDGRPMRHRYLRGACVLRPDLAAAS